MSSQNSDLSLFVPAKTEDLRDAGKSGLTVRPKYFDWGITGALDRILLRPHVIDALFRAEQRLPHGVRFLLWDGFRKLETQQALYEDLLKRWKKRFLDKTESEVKREMVGYIAVPSDDPENPSPHNTGCAIDLTLYDTKINTVLEMGTDFDDFSVRAHPSYFEINSPWTMVDEIADKNRIILRKALHDEGFKQNQKEWWHFELR